MKRVVWLVCAAIAACSVDDPRTNDSVQASGTFQSGTFQSGTFQSGTFQSGTFQNGAYQSGTFQGGTYGGSPLTSATIDKTALVITRDLGSGHWEKRTPTQICSWFDNGQLRTQPSCSTKNLTLDASPLEGAMFPATFVTPDGQSFAAPIQIASVRRDLQLAFSALPGNTDAGQLLPFHTTVDASECTNPAGCRQNSDLFLYDVGVIDAAGHRTSLCPTGESAIALAGSWSKTGEHSDDGAHFTFACTNGTIAKCTRWGYRPFGKATIVTNTGSQLADLAPFHQACVRAAAADYCAIGHSFTKNHTLVDIYDYYGLVPRTATPTNPASAFVWESEFDQHGAVQLEFERYQELSHTASYGSIDDPAPIGCPGRFAPPSAPVNPNSPELAIYMPYQRNDYSTWGTPTVHIATTTAASHSEYTVGKYLSYHVSECARHMAYNADGTSAGTAYCTHAGDARGWDATCVAAARWVCSAYAPMTPHSECSSGAKLARYATGCTAIVCGTDGFASCCTSGWTSTCVDAANQMCRGGQERTTPIVTYGFCNGPLASSTTTL